MSPEDFWLTAYIELANELGCEPSDKVVERRMQQLLRNALEQDEEPAHAEEVLDMRKKIGRFLRRVGLYDTARKCMRPVEQLQHKHRALRLYRHFVPKKGLCFDVGANRGSRTEIFLRLGAHVVSVEPLDVNLEVLHEKFDGNPNVVLVEKGLASEEGHREIHFNETATDVASMSDEWIEVAKSLERLQDPAYNWEKCKTISVTTLDKLIEMFGLPCFCKIDVEGYELEVLKGLARPIPAMSFEYTPGYIDKAIDCVRHLAALGKYKFNYSLGETLRMALENWVDASEIRRLLESFSGNTYPGDIYAVLQKA